MQNQQTALVDQELLSCSVCFEFYSDREKQAKLLPCHHTFCLTCLTKTWKRGAIICPSCRKETAITQEDIAKLQTDFHVENYKQILETVGGASTQVKCDTKEIFTQTQVSRKNTASQVEQEKHDKSTQSIDFLYCPTHKKYREYYCKECKRELWSKCYENHRSRHEVEEFVNTLVKLQSKVLERRDWIEECIKRNELLEKELRRLKYSLKGKELQRQLGSVRMMLYNMEQTNSDIQNKDLRDETQDFIVKSREDLNAAAKIALEGLQTLTKLVKIMSQSNEDLQQLSKKACRAIKEADLEELTSLVKTTGADLEVRIEEQYLSASKQIKIIKENFDKGTQDIGRIKTQIQEQMTSLDAMKHAAQVRIDRLDTSRPNPRHRLTQYMGRAPTTYHHLNTRPATVTIATALDNTLMMTIWIYFIYLLIYCARQASHEGKLGGNIYWEFYWSVITVIVTVYLGHTGMSTRNKMVNISKSLGSNLLGLFYLNIPPNHNLVFSEEISLTFNYEHLYLILFGIIYSLFAFIISYTNRDSINLYLQGVPYDTFVLSCALIVYNHDVPQCYRKIVELTEISKLYTSIIIYFILLLLTSCSLASLRRPITRQPASYTVNRPYYIKKLMHRRRQRR